MLSSKKFLITGAGGQLGREWERYLSDRGISYCAYHSRLLDITDRDLLYKTFEKEKPDVVVNCAAYTRVDQAEEEREKAFLVNETGVKYLTDCCRSWRSTFVHYSTDYIFPGRKSDIAKYPEGYPEYAEAGPVNVYGQSKRAGEIVVESAGSNGPDWLLIRVSWLCGEFGSNFVKTMIRLGKEKKSVDVVNDQFGSPSFAFDVVDKSWELLGKGQRGVFHISSRGLISWADLAAEIFRLTQQKVVVSAMPSSGFPVAAKRPAYSLLSNKKIESAGLNVLDWKQGLSKLVMQFW